MAPLLESYSGSIQREARRVVRPRRLDELLAWLLTHDVARDGTVTARATGHSLHDQALGAFVVLSLDDLPHEIHVRVDDELGLRADGSLLRWSSVEVTGWTPWECVVRATLGLGPPAAWDRSEGAGLWQLHGDAEDPWDERAINRARVNGAGRATLPKLVPYTFVSSGRITTAGSLSGDGVWRLSTVLGRESDAVVWLDLLRSDGTTIRLFHPAHGLFDGPRGPEEPLRASSAAENERYFHAVVGGFGLMGIILRIKYLLLELDESVHASEIADLHERRAGVSSPALPAFGERALSAIERLADFVLKQTVRPDWPSYPHSGPEHLGRLGEDLTLRALTWMRELHDPGSVADELARHWHEDRARGATALPRRASALTRGRFALVFPNWRGRGRTVLGQLAYGAASSAQPRFRLWDREYSWTSTARLLRYRLLPWAARIGERIVYRGVFEECIERGPTANPIPECGFFLEGHAVALAGRRRAPRTLQQAWNIPFQVDASGRLVRGRAELVACIAALRRISRRHFWQRNAVRFQVCDIKCAPESFAVLSSAPGGPAFMVTVTLENASGYRWPWSVLGSPEDALAELSAELEASGARVHLTKGLFVQREQLRRLYAGAWVEHTRIKRSLDPRGLWHSSFASTFSP